MDSFQSTFPRGERRFLPIFFADLLMISIHVPAWGTTGITRYRYVLQTNFNPRSRVGNDGKAGRKGVHTCYFNPRSRVGNDSIKRRQKHFCDYFNPRSRVGNDRRVTTSCTRKKISIHVPAWGTTSTQDGNKIDLTLFQSTFPRGERPVTSI